MEFGGKQRKSRQTRFSINPVVFLSDKKFCVLKVCIYQIYMTKKACAVVIKVSMPLIRSSNKFLTDDFHNDFQ